MRTKKFIVVLLYLISIICILKGISLLWKKQYFEILAWSLVCSWGFWIFIAFKNDEDMPHYAGNFDYKEGQNQIARWAYLLMMIALLIIGITWA